jgi:uncharacterized protein (DUF2062 family)
LLLARAPGLLKFATDRPPVIYHNIGKRFIALLHTRILRSGVAAIAIAIAVAVAVAVAVSPHPYLNHRHLLVAFLFFPRWAALSIESLI